MEACIIYVESKNYAYMALEGFVESAKIKEFALKTSELCKQKKVSCIIFDTSKLQIIKQIDIQWLIEQVFPVLRNYNLSKIAFLLPENPFGLTSLKSLIKHIDTNKVEVFQKMEEAEAWIFSDDKTYEENNIGTIH
jgi:hypothetical protein